MKKHSDIPFEYNYITDGIYIGTNQCCETHFNEGLLKKRITADISLEWNRLDSPFGVAFYIWLPVRNNQAPSQDQLKLGVEILKNLMAMKRKVYVHCKNGHGRAPTLVAAYLMSKGLSFKEAVALLKKKRPIVHLNRAQIKCLKRFLLSGFRQH